MHASQSRWEGDEDGSLIIITTSTLWAGRLGRSVRTRLVRPGNGLVPSGPIYRTDGPSTPLVALTAPCTANISSEPFFVPATMAVRLTTMWSSKVVPSVLSNILGWTVSPCSVASSPRSSLVQYGSLNGPTMGHRTEHAVSCGPIPYGYPK